jgi:formamidopyrimidine-DNA glycosylase
MPELPEVETMVRDLAPRLAGLRIQRVEADFPGIVVWPPSFEDFVLRVKGAQIGPLERRGKYALFHLDSGDTLVIHRGMTGSVLLRPADRPMEPYVRILFQLDDGSQLRFSDPRKFGKVLVLDAAGAERPLPWAKMGPEPMNGAFTDQVLRDRLKGRTGLIKPLLLNQQVVAGLGNIYVDEALHLARVHPLRRADTLKWIEIRRLRVAIVEVLLAAIDGRGTTFSNYTDVEGRAGEYQDRLRVFHKAGSPCPRCRTPIERLVVGGRGTHVCRKCQRM